MELLHPVAEERAVEFFGVLEAREPELAPLAEVIDRVLARAQAELPWCGPRPQPGQRHGAVRRHARAHRPFLRRRPNLYGSLTTDAHLVARAIAPDVRRHMFDLPLAWTGPWDPRERARMEAALAAADADLRR